MAGPGARKDWTAGYGIPNATDAQQGEFPNDPDIIRARINAVRAELTAMLGALAKIEELWVVPVEAAVPQPVEQAPAAERDFAAEFAEKAARAQAEVFAPAVAVVEVETADPAALVIGYVDPPGWTCPAHGASALLQKTSPRGRAYLKCTAAGCAEFEK
jgi:hypothetical protein